MYNHTEVFQHKNEHMYVPVTLASSGVIVAHLIPTLYFLIALAQSTVTITNIYITAVLAECSTLYHFYEHIAFLWKHLACIFEHCCTL